ncbi:lasso peptide biosynthesis B2 protein [uncultured Sphingopyxis sp.]|uniref:lasso peptide biosynthesis B2 protein n=1 Tax=uncultured Sphingopyxis sp. TaxID=310581 RepID=UPI00259487A7|nr:lasso peptide biosynthesis B2 protein [uncultured Sphingopyxis sp.]
MTLLVDTGLFVRSDLGFRIEAPAFDVPADDLSRPDSRRSGLRSIFGAWCALAWAARALKPDRLPSTIEQLLRDKLLLDRSGQESELRALGTAFARARTFVPIAPRCLVDSLALYRMALRRSLAPTLVFGVRTNPFAAHCWLQSGACVLTGTAEEARNYQPILVV